MNKIFYLTVLLMSTLCLSQKHRFETVSISTLSKEKNGKWAKWTEPKPTKIIVTADQEKHRFVIYSERIQLFEILKYEEPKTTNKETTNAYICKDDAGENCTLTIVSPNNAKIKQLYVAYEDYIIEYDVIYLGDK